jgi:hypothetical protein
MAVGGPLASLNLREEDMVSPAEYDLDETANGDDDSNPVVERVDFVGADEPYSYSNQ